MTAKRTIGTRWPLWLLAIVTGAATLWFVVTALRLAAAGVPFDYDEGVYWQTVRAMAAGGTLYRDIFLSQPPLFAWIARIAYGVFGETLFAARASIVLMSLVGLGGALALGWAIAGRAGGLIAVLALASSWTSLRAGVVLQADGPSVMLHLPALAAALWWWRSPRPWLAIICGALVAASIGIKLLGITILLPVALVGLFALADARNDGPLLRRRLAQLGQAVLAGSLVAALCLVPYLADWDELVRQVVTFHVDARIVDGRSGLDSVRANFNTLASLLRANTGLCVAALAGAVAGLLARPRVALVLLALVAADVVLLALQTPIFGHHLVLLMPPLAGLAASIPLPFRATPRAATAGLAAVLVLAGQVTLAGSVDALSLRPDAATRTAVADISRAVAPGRYLVTDDQFVAALAGRDTPAALVDTSTVRILSGYLGAEKLCNAIEAPAVAAVYLGTGRLDDVPAFLECIARSYTLAATYGRGRGMWVRSRP